MNQSGNSYVRKRRHGAPPGWDKWSVWSGGSGWSVTDHTDQGDHHWSQEYESLYNGPHAPS